MKDFRPLSYIKRHVVSLILFFILMTAGLYVALSLLQTYTAQVTIEYVYNGADQGLAPDGTKLDTSEIYSSAVISRVLDNLHLDQKDHPIDTVRSAVLVEQVEDEEVETVKTALNEDGESSDLQSTKYTISYVVDWKDGKQLQEMAQSVLDEILDVYFTLFSEKYINQSTLVNSISGLERTGYDYIEQVELIETALASTLEQLEARAELAPGFYSTETGYSYSDLEGEVRLLDRSRITPLLAYILNHQVTKDKGALLAKYGQRVKDQEFGQERYDIRIEEVENILDAYVEKLRVSNNTAQSEVITGSRAGLLGGNVIGDVEYPDYLNAAGQWQPFDQTTEYEMLLQSWIDLSDSYDSSVVEAAYCQYVIDCFSGNDEAIETYQRSPARVTLRGEEAGERLTADTAEGEDTADTAEKAEETAGAGAETDAGGGEAAAGSPVSYGGAETVSVEKMERLLTGDSDIYVELPKTCTPEDIAYVEGQIESILVKMDELYAQIETTGSEFNDYIGAEYIRMLSSNHVIEGMNLPLYMAVGAVFFLVLGCFGVILLSRVGDMIEYLAYTDHRLRMPNRAACDRYIDRCKERILPSGFGCIYLQIVNQNEINRKLGREMGDEVLRIFAAGVRGLCSHGEDFAGYNGSGQFIVFLVDGGDGEMDRLNTDLEILLTERLAEKGVTLQYYIGISESRTDGQYRIRGLLTQAIGRKAMCEAGIRRSGQNSEDRE